MRNIFLALFLLFAASCEQPQQLLDQNETSKLIGVWWKCDYVDAGNTAGLCDGKSFICESDGQYIQYDYNTDTTYGQWGWDIEDEAWWCSVPSLVQEFSYNITLLTDDHLKMYIQDSYAYEYIRY